MNKIILFFTLLSVFVFIRMDAAFGTDVAGGLRFYSQDKEFTKRTSFTLFDDYKQVPDSFSLDFDFKIYDSERFGYIFRIIEKETANSETPLCHFLCHPEAAQGHNTLFFIQNNQKSGKILVVKNEKRWIPFHLKLNCRKGEATISCNDSVFHFPIDLPKKPELNVTFGLILRNNAEVAAFDIRNVRFSASPKQTYYWPLNEISGDVAHDMLQGEDSEVKNPNWLVKQHFFWNKIYEGPADMMCGVEYDQARQNIMLINKDSLVSFNVQQNTVTSLKYNETRPFAKDQHFSILNPLTNELLSYDFHFLQTEGQKGYSVYQPENRSWTIPEMGSAQEENHFHLMFWNNDTTKLIKFGGYAHYKFFNDFKSFDFVSNTWEDVRLKGDVIYPRSHTAMGKDPENQLYYLFGGLGNKDGEQVLGVSNFYDLYSIDFRKRESTRIWELNDASLSFIPRSQMLVEPSDTSCYILCSQSDKQDAALCLYKFSLVRPHYEIVSDSLPSNFYNLAGNAFLFLNSKANELYCVIRQTFINKTESQISIYKLNYPPVRLSYREMETHSRSKGWIFTAVFLALIAGFGIWYVKLRSSKPKTVASVSSRPQFRKVTEPMSEKPDLKQEVVLHDETVQILETSKEYIRPRANAIWLLGKFTIFDKKGHNITHLCSNKIRSLFFLIFFSSFFEDGINSDELSDVLWPGMDKNRTKNNRSVTINHLRKIFEDMEGISLIHEDRNWKISYQESVYIDLVDLLKKIKNKEANPREIVRIYSLGNLLQDEKIPELDKFRGNFETDTIELLNSYGHQFFAEQNYQLCAEIARIIHSYFDELNEKALNLKLVALSRLRLHNKARQEYDNFCQRFKLLMDVEFTVPFNKLTETLE